MMTETTPQSPSSPLEVRVARIEGEPLRELGDKRGLWAGTKRAFVDIWHRRELLRLLINRELKARYKDSNLGFVWSMFKPLSQLLIYFIVIGQFLGASRGIPSFAIFVFTGLTAWGFFLEAVTGGTGSIVANSGLIKKVYLPREIFPLSTLGTAAVNSAIQLVVLLVAIGVTGAVPSVSQLAYLPLSLIVLVLYATLCALALSALNVYMRDIQHLIEVITSWRSGPPRSCTPTATCSGRWPRAIRSCTRPTSLTPSRWLFSASSGRCGLRGQISPAPRTS